MKKIVPAILAKDLAEFKKKLTKATSFFDEIQIDIIDGDFANNKTVELVDIPSLKAGKNYQAHLMVADPADYLTNCKRLGIQTVIFHNEIDEDITETIEKIRGQDLNVFLASAPESEIETFEKYIPLVDGILLMGGEPGFMGQEFQPRVLDKIKALRAKYPDLIIEIDGGVNLKNMKDIFDAGANILVVNSVFFKVRSQKKAVEEFNSFIS